MKRRSFLLIPLLGLSTACAGPAPQRAALETELLQRIRISAVSVDTSALGETTGSGRTVFTKEVKASVEKAAKSRLVGLGGGSQRATAVITLTSVNIISAGQAYVIGGESVMRGTVSVIDPSNGETLMKPVKLSSGGGGWVLGGLVAVVTMEDVNTELGQLSLEFSERAATLIAGS